MLSFKTALGLTAWTFLAAACSSSSSSTNPSTVSLEDLNPPGGLTTVTHQGKIELHWHASNVETDFQGYDVFVTTGAVSALTAPAFPTAAKDLTKDSVPRCTGNSKIFETFGFPASQNACSGDPADNVTASTTTAASSLKDDSTTTADPDETPISVMSICDENTTDTTISLVASVGVLGDQVCTISKMTDAKGAKTALKDGQQYTFFVVAVKGTAKDSISWTSNFVQDTPALIAFDGGGANNPNAKPLNTTITLVADEVKVLPLSKILAAVTADTVIADTDLVTGSCTGTPTPGAFSDALPCTINQTNDATSQGIVDGIFLGRLGTGSYPERAFISTPKGSQVAGNTGAISLQGRGPQVLDPVTNAFEVSIPGDAASTGTYDLAGTTYPIYGNQVFDVKIAKTATTFLYGKLVIGQPALATASDPTSALTVPLTLIVDPTVDDTDY